MPDDIRAAQAIAADYLAAEAVMAAQYHDDAGAC
jgi:hypothetical protein